MDQQFKPIVLVTRSNIPVVAMELLQERFEIKVWDKPGPCPKSFLVQNVAHASAIFCCVQDQIDHEVLENADPSLKVISTMSVGVDHINLETAQQRDIAIGYTPSVLTNAVADNAVALLLAAARRHLEARREIDNGNWLKNSSWVAEYLPGQDLAGSTVGIYGMGRIGQAVMQRLKGFEVSRFIYSGRNEKPEIKDATFVSFKVLCKESDFIVVTCALTPGTKEKFGNEAFGLMKRNCVFINVSRGETVDQNALVKALKDKTIFAAGLDVMAPEPLAPDHELTKLTNCVLTPHIGTATEKTRTEMAVMAAENIIAAIDGRPMPARFC